MGPRTPLSASSCAASCHIRARLDVVVVFVVIVVAVVIVVIVVVVVVDMAGGRSGDRGSGPSWFRC